MPKDPEERKRLIISMTEQTKKDLNSGTIKMWGISAGGGHGFSVFEGDGKEVMAGTMKYNPYIKFKVKPMLSLDEFMDVMKGMEKESSISAISHQILYVRRGHFTSPFS
jgi:hypothetical protein